MNILANIMQLFTGSSQDIQWKSKPVTERELIEYESEIGRHLFGPIPKGHKREFFCLDEYTWVWYEEWQDEQKKTVSRTVRYEVHQRGILKVKDGGQYQYIDGEELKNFSLAVRLYYEQVARSIYRYDPYTGQSLQHARSSAPLIQ